MESIKRARRVTLNCAECGAEFTRKPSALRGDKEYYCGRKCANAGYKRLYSGANSVRYNSTVVLCAQCGVSLTRKATLISNRTNHFCSIDCMGNWRSEHMPKGADSPHYNRVPTICRQCGAAFAVIPRALNGGGNFCDARCFGLWLSANRSGPNNHLWKGGKLPYYGPDWYAQRRKARERDNHICQHCGITKAQAGRELDVHHQIPFRVYGIERHEEANHLDNLICLCKTCHKHAEHDPTFLGAL